MTTDMMRPITCRVPSGKSTPNAHPLSRHQRGVFAIFVRAEKPLELQKTRVEFEIPADDRLLESDLSRSTIDTRLEASWRECQRQYIARIERCYTNWNAGSTKDGECTYDFAYNRKTTVRRARMASLWTCDALPPDLERLGPQDFDVDGVHLHPLHYGTIRDAVEEVVTSATLLPTPSLPTMSVRFNVKGRITTSHEGGDSRQLMSATGSLTCSGR